MKGKQMVTVLLLLFVVASVIMLVYRQKHGAPTPVAVSQSRVVQPESDVPVITKDAAQQPAQEALKNPERPIVKSVGSASPVFKAAAPEPLESKVVVYYFHGNSRCYTCKRIETLAQEAVKNSFADDLRSGRVSFRAVNVEEPANEHFVADYQLATRSVVLARFTDGKQDTWKNLDRVWTLVRDPEGFHRYVVDETRQLLGGV